LVSWNCKFNLKVLPSYYYFLFYQHWQFLLKWTDSLLYNSKPNLAEMFSMRSYTRVFQMVQTVTTHVKDIHRNIYTRFQFNPFSGSWEEVSWKSL
jgi:hypothetical protein